MFNDKQKQVITEELKNKFIAGEAKDYEIVITLVTMAKAGRITVDDIKPMLMSIHSDNKIDAIIALSKAQKLIDENMIDEIIAEVEGLH